MNRKWNEKNGFEKTLDVISFVALCVWLVFETLEKTNKSIEFAQLGACISILIVCICQAISYWKIKRAFSYVAIGGSVLLLTVLILTLM